MVFPWQTEQWQQILQAKQANRLPHALLLTGITGVGKAHFADQLTTLLLCQQPGQEACECHPCRLIAGRSHPNVLWIQPEKEGQAIKIDQIREVSDFVNQSSFQGTHRIVIIHPAHAMNMHAANALLKTLEEPAPGAILVLISDQHASLPATILSRCQRLLFPRPKKAEALRWLISQRQDSEIEADLLLNLAHGAPLAALRLVEDKTLVLRENVFQALYSLRQKQPNPISAAASLRDAELLSVLDFILSWMRDLLCQQLGDDEQRMINKDYKAQLADLQKTTDLTSNVKFMEYVQQLCGQISRGMNLNKQLLVESVLIKWAEGY